MESGSRSSVEYEVEVEDGIASLYANDELVESIEEDRMSELLKEYITNPIKSYVGETSSGIHLYQILELDLDDEIAQISAAAARINNSVTTHTTVASHNKLDLDQILDQFRSAVKDNL